MNDVARNSSLSSLEEREERRGHEGNAQLEDGDWGRVDLEGMSMGMVV